MNILTPRGKGGIGSGGGINTFREKYRKYFSMDRFKVEKGLLDAVVMYLSLALSYFIPRIF